MLRWGWGSATLGHRTLCGKGARPEVHLALLGQKATKGPKLLGQLFGSTFRANLSTAGGTQWCPVVQLGARECGADGLWVTFTGLPQAVVLGGWSQNPNKIEGPQIHFVVQPKDK